MELSSRKPTVSEFQYRKVRSLSSKIVFLSCEGSVTEEEYFSHISELYDNVKSKIQFISVNKEILSIPPRRRTSEQVRLLSKSRPKQLVERIEQFKREKESQYQFSQYPDDEFWIVTDVDNNWSEDIIDSENAKSYLDEWTETISCCQEKNYGFAVSNPFFEAWLLLHFTSPNDDDKKYAVTEEHPYEKTKHFQNRLRESGHPLIKRKHIKKNDYQLQNVNTALQNAKLLHIDRADLCPHYFASTVYLLIEKIVEMSSND